MLMAASLGWPSPSQESQKTYASKDKRFVHPSAASERESDSSTYSIFNNINMCITEEPYTTRFI
jgi:hypothetical protein